jgi:shikimate dehydrogenase
MAAGLTQGAPDQYGVAGHPVAHSWSPFIHGMFAKECEQNLVYRLFDIEPAHFRGEVLRLLTSGVKGLNVTVPHKEAAAELVNTLTPRASRAQAVNTIALQADNSLLGDNTDGIGLMRDLQDNLGFEVAGKRVLILGAGGATRGILAPLIEAGPQSLVIANRTLSRAQGLASSFKDMYAIDTCEFKTVTGPPYDLILNATSASLQGQMPELPPGLVGEDTFCYDLAYGKGHTPFTLWAKSLYAARISKGWGMLVEQAAESFFLWRGVRPSTHSVLEALTRKA